MFRQPNPWTTINLQPFLQLSELDLPIQVSCTLLLDWSLEKIDKFAPKTQYLFSQSQTRLFVIGDYSGRWDKLASRWRSPARRGTGRDAHATWTVIVIVQMVVVAQTASLRRDLDSYNYFSCQIEKKAIQLRTVRVTDAQPIEEEASDMPQHTVGTVVN